MKNYLISLLVTFSLLFCVSCAGGGPSTVSSVAPAFQYSTAYNGTRAAGATSGISYKYITPVYAGRVGRTSFSAVYQWGGRFGTVLTGPLAGVSYFSF